MNDEPFRMIAVRKLFSRDELILAHEIYNRHRDNTPFYMQKLKNEIRDKVVLPALDHINQVTRQQNNPDFMAYALIHVYNQLTTH